MTAEETKDGRPGGLPLQAPTGLGLSAGIPDAVRALTESGDFYTATREAWARYRAAVNTGDWDEVMRFETGTYEDFQYAP